MRHSGKNTISSNKLFSYSSIIRQKWSAARQKRRFSKKKTLRKEELALMASLSQYAKTNFDLTLDDASVHSMLDHNDWDLKRAMTEIDDTEEARHGLLVAPPSLGDSLLGCENDGGTSCYIDSLLFAMYIHLTAFDPLLTYDTSDQLSKRNLQTSLRLFVNTMRKGRLVREHVVDRLRRSLQDAGWHGQNERGYWRQEDASELLLFLTEAFDLPYLPFQMRLFHGAEKDVDDDKLMTDRVLSLAIPSENEQQQPPPPIRLESILFDHFYNNIVTGVKRRVDYHEPNASAPASPKSTVSAMSLPKKVNVMERRQEVAVNAWQVLELLPFYTGMNEQGVQIKSQSQGSFPDSRMVLPIILKRYHYNSRGQQFKDRSHVQVPANIQFHQFVNQNADQPTCSTCGRKIEGIMRLRSAVCHKGPTPQSGHYVAYSRVDQDNEEPKWFKLDDLAVSQRVKVFSQQQEGEIWSELAKDGYLFFYELDMTCQHTEDPPTVTRRDSIQKASLTDRSLADNIPNEPTVEPSSTHSTTNTRQKSKIARHNGCCVM